MNSSTYHVCLQETSVVRLVAKLWTSVSMIKRLLKINFKKCKGMPTNLYSAILLKIIDLNALNPESRKRIQALVKPVGDSIFAWLQGHADFFDSLEEAIKFCPNLRWFSDGTIDNRATAEILLEFDDISYTKRFILACIYCFEQHIVIFWKRLKMSGDVTIDKHTAFKYPLANYWLEFLKHKTTDQIDSVTDRSKACLGSYMEIEQQLEEGIDDECWDSLSIYEDNYIVETPRSPRRYCRLFPQEMGSDNSCTIYPTLMDIKSKAKLKTIVKKSDMEKEKFSEDDVINFLEYGFDKSCDEPMPRTSAQVKTRDDKEFFSYINCCPTMNVHYYNR